MDEEQFVTSLYRAILSREPDQPGLITHVNSLKEGKPPETVAREFIHSAEFHSQTTDFTQHYPLDQTGPMPVDLDLTAEQERALWAHVARAWSNLGASEPYWSVLVDPRWKASEMTASDILNAFYATGRAEMQRLDAWFARNQVLAPSTGTCAEYGCGVGRCTIWLAKRYARVLAFDISEPHLRLAKARAGAEGLRNIEFVHVQSEADLNRLREIDLFYSLIVLQHNPPPLILSILRSVFGGLKPHGLAFFQLPTYGVGYSFNLREYLNNMADRGMEMHFVPQRAVFDLGSVQGVQTLEVSPDGSIGNFGQWISSTFLMHRPGVCPGSVAE